MSRKAMKVFDMHCDTLSALMYDRKNNIQSELRQNNHHLDLMKMMKGDYMLQCFAVYINKEYSDNVLLDGMKLVDTFYNEMEKNKDIISQVRCYADVEENMKAGKMSAILTGEEGDICAGSLEMLRNYYRLGLRMMTLTWNHENELAYPNYVVYNSDGSCTYNADASKGLKQKGFEFIAEMERLGIVIDVSHLSDAGFWDVYNNTGKPFVASHSNARAMNPHVRNLTDDMIRAFGERGCVTGLNYCGAFLNESGDVGNDAESRIDDMVRHVKYITNLGGMDVMALGSDFDGIGGKLELADASYLPRLHDALIKAGFTESDAEKIFYKNALRVFKECLDK